MADTLIMSNAPAFSPDGNHMFFTVTSDMVVPNAQGVPVNDFSSVADRVDPVDVKVGDWVGKGTTRMFNRVTAAPRTVHGKSKGKTWVATLVETTGDQFHFQPDARVWVVRG